MLDKLKSGVITLSASVIQDELRELAFFTRLTDGDKDELFAASSMQVYQPNDMVIQEAEIEDFFYIVVSGEAEVRKGGQLISTLSKGECFGEMGFLRSIKRTATVIAMSKLLVLKVNSILVESLSQECQLRYYKSFNESLIDRLTLTNKRLSNLNNRY